ncbi:MAG TPA: twin-arginine translocase subunit TatC [Prevotellaceae bacterium]|jgi:sec-independent protein translocase protein TatC|nr:twin-arginine translocase subunit TatC [Prevotellaceae bacterium]
MGEHADDQNVGTFWDHLDVLRSCLFKIAVVTVGASVIAFCFKELLFDIVLAPRESDFITYRLFGLHPEKVNLMNIGLTEQFMIHMKTSFYVGFLLASPYILYQIFCFVAPGLYDNERKYAVKLVGGVYVMFMIGTLINYLCIFPMTVNFLGNYKVSEDVANMLTLQSYMDTLLMMNLVMGIVFELPMICWILGKLGLINAAFMRNYRRHAIVIILIASAVITPTGDAFTLSIVALPIWMLYEISIIIVARTQRKRQESDDHDDDDNDADDIEEDTAIEPAK